MNPAKTNLPETLLDLDEHVPPEIPGNLDLAAMGDPIPPQAPPPLVNQPGPSIASSERHGQSTPSGSPDNRDA
jgi:hypothetical protein